MTLKAVLTDSEPDTLFGDVTLIGGAGSVG